MNNILIIEDEKSVSEILKAYLEKEGYGVYSTESGLNGIEIFRKEKINHSSNNKLDFIKAIF